MVRVLRADGTMEPKLRDIANEIVLWHGQTRVAALRRIYGAAFGTNIDGRKALGEIIEVLDAQSLRTLIDDYQAGHLFGAPGPGA